MNLNIRAHCTISGNKAVLNGNEVYSGEAGQEAVSFLSALYKHLQIDYRKFFKMDKLSKLGFLASELLLDGTDRELSKEDTALILWNSSSSLDTDIAFQQTIQSAENYFPSPSDFVYTLPNIVAGEIAIRNKLFGETSFYISEKMDAQELYNRVSAAFGDPDLRRVVCGWIDYLQGNYKAVLFLIEKDRSEKPAFTANTLEQIFNT